MDMKAGRIVLRIPWLLLIERLINFRVYGGKPDMTGGCRNVTVGGWRDDRLHVA